MSSELGDRLRRVREHHLRWVVELDRKWLEAESLTRAVNPFKEVTVRIKIIEVEPVEPSQNGELPEEHLLGFRKFDGQWQLCYGIFTVAQDRCDDPGHWRPIHECTRREKVEAAGALPRLLSRIAEAAEEDVEEIARAVSSLDTVLEPLRRTAERLRAGSSESGNGVPAVAPG
jgi:hypothetical protein